MIMILGFCAANIDNSVKMTKRSNCIYYSYYSRFAYDLYIYHLMPNFSRLLHDDTEPAVYVLVYYIRITMSHKSNFIFYSSQKHPRAYNSKLQLHTIRPVVHNFGEVIHAYFTIKYY